MRCRVWWARPLDDARLRAILDDAERSRHAALRRPADRARFTAAHALARIALGAQVGVAPERLCLRPRCPRCGGPHGAPRPDPDLGLHLSVSHSGDRVAVALAHRPVGVDVEQVSELPDVEGLARQALTPAERDGRRFSATELLTLWTRKEAALKATGHGLAIPLHDLVVSGPDEPAGVLRWTGIAAAPAQLRDLSPGPGHVGCVCVLGDGELIVEERCGDDLLAAPER